MGGRFFLIEAGLLLTSWNATVLTMDWKIWRLTNPIEKYQIRSST